MATFSSVTRQHVLRAIAEYDDLGAEGFLALYGFEPSVGALIHEDRRYDARAVLAVAHRHATGRLATAEEFHGDLQATGLLSRRGFEVTEPPSAVRAAVKSTPTRTPRAARTPSARPAPKRAAAREERLTICPTCSMALPATGICDSCG